MNFSLRRSISVLSTPWNAGSRPSFSLLLTALTGISLTLGCGGGNSSVTPPDPPPPPHIPPLAETTPVASSGSWGVMASSKVSYVATKDGSIQVPGSFSGVSGTFTLDPQDLSVTRGSVELDLSTLQTGVPPRDDNIRKAFFEIPMGDGFKTAVFTFEGVTSEKKSLSPGETTAAEVQGRMTLHGQSQPMTARLSITRSENGGYAIRTTQPFLVDVTAFGMEAQRKALLTLCAHQDLNPTFPVTVELALSQDPKSLALPSGGTEGASSSGTPPPAPPATPSGDAPPAPPAPPASSTSGISPPQGK